MKEKQQVQDALISNINIIRIGNEEALTINNDLLENTNYFLTMMRGLDPNFMLSELKIEKTDIAQAMNGSVLSQNPSASASGKNEDKLNQEQTSHSRKQAGRSGHHGHQRDQDVFFTLNERDFSTSALKEQKHGRDKGSSGILDKSATSIGTSSADFRNRTSAYTRQGTKPHPNAQQQDSQTWQKDVFPDRSKMTLGQILSHVIEKAINI